MIRKTEVLTIQGWREIPFKDLKKGDKFRLWDPDVNGVHYRLYKNPKGISEWTADTDPYPEPGGLHGISIVMKEEEWE